MGPDVIALGSWQCLDFDLALSDSQAYGLPSKWWKGKGRRTKNPYDILFNLHNKLQVRPIL